MGPFFCTKNEKIDFEENKFNERFCECSSFYIKRPNNIECLLYKVTKLLYICCVSFWLLAHESRDLPQAETKQFFLKAEQIYKMTTIFTQNYD